MTTKCKTYNAEYSDIIDFFTGIECNVTQFKLLCFIMRRPRTRLGLDLFASVLDNNGTSLKQELTALIERGILVQRDEEGIITFPLSDDETILWPLLRLNSLDWREKLDIMSRLNSPAAS